MQRQAGFLPIARKLDKLLVRLEGKLAKASLSQHQQHWVMFTVMQAYLCRRQCSEAMADEHRLPQVKALATHLKPSPYLASAACSLWCASMCSSLSYVSAESLCSCTGLQACMHASHANLTLSHFSLSCLVHMCVCIYAPAYTVTLERTLCTLSMFTL